MELNFFNSKKNRNITNKMNNIDDFKKYIDDSKDKPNINFYIIIDEVKYIIGLYISFCFGKIGLNNIHIILINNGSIMLLKQYILNNEYISNLLDHNNFNNEIEFKF